jgi:hypothetical protein
VCAPLIERVRRHPLRIVAVLGLVKMAGDVWWISTARRLGGFDADESDYLAKAFALRRAFTITEPSHFGPLMPLLSAALLRIGPHSATTAMAAQPLAQVVTAVAAAGLGRALAGSRASIVSGLVALGYCGAILEARTYQLAGGVAMCLMLAMWALVSSDRGERLWPMLGAGAAVGAMLLSRTMAIGFLPAIALGAISLAGRSRLGRRNLMWGALVTLAVAGPWWWWNRGPVFDHLLTQGYGPDAEMWRGPQSSPWLRPLLRLATPIESGRLLTVVVALFVAGFAARRLRQGWRSWRPEVLALLIVIVGSLAALLTTANLGTWFDLPIHMVAMVLAIATLCHLPPRRRRAALRVVPGLAVLSIILSFTDQGGGGDVSSPLSIARVSLSGHQADRSVVFGEDGEIEQQRADGDVEVYLTGANNSHLFGLSELRFANEMAGARQTSISRLGVGSVEQLRDIAIGSTASQRVVLVVIDNPRVACDAMKVRAMADAASYRELRSVPLPRGGTVQLLAATFVDHPVDRAPGRGTIDTRSTTASSPAARRAAHPSRRCTSTPAATCGSVSSTRSGCSAASPSRALSTSGAGSGCGASVRHSATTT